MSAAAHNEAAARVCARLLAQRVVPVLRLPDPALTLRAVDCLRQAGFATVEITLTTPAAFDLIRTLAQRDPQALIGAGTVLDAQAARAALQAGASFLVTPCVLPEVASLAHEAGAAALLGAFTPTEVLAAHRAGADIVKVFPAASGGPAHVAALRAVFPHIALCPTGGLDLDNLRAYLDAGAALAGVGQAIIDWPALRAGEAARVIAHAQRYLARAGVVRDGEHQSG